MEINKYIEHSLLKQDATKKELLQLFDEAKQHKFFGVCINPCNVMLAAGYLQGSGIKIVTVVGFPLGASLNEIKAVEAQQPVEPGSDDEDLVLSGQAVTDAAYNYVRNDIKTVQNAVGDQFLKLII